jgi:Fic family protein
MYFQIKNFFANLPVKSDAPDIEPAAWIHGEFIRVHPFSDGNGRTARMIMNYQLMRSGWLPVSVPKEERQRYYEALEVYAVSGDIQPFAAFIAELEDKELDAVIAMIEQAAGRDEAFRTHNHVIEEGK